MFFKYLGEAECCPDARWAHKFPGTEPTEAQLEQMREEIRTEHGDVCQEIEMNNDPVYGGYVCMNHVRSTPAPLHDCAIGEFVCKTYNFGIIFSSIDNPNAAYTLLSRILIGFSLLMYEYFQLIG